MILHSSDIHICRPFVSAHYAEIKPRIKPHSATEANEQNSIQLRLSSNSHRRNVVVQRYNLHAYDYNNPRRSTDRPSDHALLVRRVNWTEKLCVV